ncbi:MAG: transcription antitermination protein NusB [Leptolyngbyaceae cyanobacterium SM1_3_5]|nr:transcription antitermination protein NusB [Leptolyngbyaceae cyanobacterium SM1_3_5]
MQARRIARELALLSISQLPPKPDRLTSQQLQSFVVAAVRTLTAEVHDSLETAAAELQRGNDRLLNSETRAVDVNSARAMVQDAVELTQTALNRMGAAIDLPEMIQLANQQEVRHYAIELLSMVQVHRPDVDALLDECMVDWQVKRLARVDRDILRIAAVEMQYLGVPDQVAINEAVEIAKRYSGEDDYRFINGVLRRVSNRLKGKPIEPEPAAEAMTLPPSGASIEAGEN